MLKGFLPILNWKQSRSQVKFLPLPCASSSWDLITLALRLGKGTPSQYPLNFLFRRSYLHILGSLHTVSHFSSTKMCKEVYYISITIFTTLIKSSTLEILHTRSVTPWRTSMQYWGGCKVPLVDIIKYCREFSELWKNTISTERIYHQYRGEIPSVLTGNTISNGWGYHQQCVEIPSVMCGDNISTVWKYHQPCVGISSVLWGKSAISSMRPSFILPDWIK